MHEISTSNFGYVAFKHARGGRLTRLDKGGPRYTFVYQTKRSLLVEEYNSGATCSGIAIVQAMPLLKRAMTADAPATGVRS